MPSGCSLADGAVVVPHVEKKRHLRTSASYHPRTSVSIPRARRPARDGASRMTHPDVTDDGARAALGPHHGLGFTQR
jgi:hypothetical protein